MEKPNPNPEGTGGQPNPIPTPNPAPATPPAGSAERPSWLPEGINSPEELRAAYDKLKNPEGGEPEGQPQEEPPGPAGSDPEADAAAAKFVEAAGLDIGALTKEIAASGTVNADSLAKLEAVAEKAGLPKGMVQSYIAGKKAEADLYMNGIYAVTGGQDGYKDMAEWAQKNLSQEDRKAYSDMVTSGDFKKASFATRALYDRYRANARIPGKIMRGSSSADLAGDVFSSMDEQKAAMADPRYKHDPAYRNAVLEKTIRTSEARRNRR